MNGLRHIPLINGVEYSWADVTVSIAGQPVVGITKVDYSDEQQIDNIYGAGQQPVARGYGNITPAASITLLRSAIEAIRPAAASRRLQDIAPFDVIVSFVPLNGGAIVTHRIRNAQFTRDANSIAQGDTKNEVELPLLPSHIEW